MQIENFYLLSFNRVVVKFNLANIFRKLYDFEIYYFVFSQLHMRRRINTVQALL